MHMNNVCIKDCKKINKITHKFDMVEDMPVCQYKLFY